MNIYNDTNLFTTNDDCIYDNIDKSSFYMPICMRYNYMCGNIRQYCRTLMEMYQISYVKKVINAIKDFDAFVYDDVFNIAYRLGIPQPISDYRNLTDEFKEEYAEFMKKQNIFNTNEFSSNILYVYCPEKRSRSLRLYNAMLQKEVI